MQNKVYLAFKHPNQHDTVEESKSGLEDFIVKVLEALIPVGNPDFEDQLNKVDHWAIEYDKDKEDTIREIGYDKNNKVLLILPLNNNLGYWSNNNFSLEDYHKINAQEVSEEEFDKDWNCFNTVGA